MRHEDRAGGVFGAGRADRTQQQAGETSCPRLPTTSIRAPALTSISTWAGWSSRTVTVSPRRTPFAEDRIKGIDNSLPCVLGRVPARDSDEPDPGPRVAAQGVPGRDRLHSGTGGAGEEDCPAQRQVGRCGSVDPDHDAVDGGGGLLDGHVAGTLSGIVVWARQSTVRTRPRRADKGWVAHVGTIVKTFAQQLAAWRSSSSGSAPLGRGHLAQPAHSFEHDDASVLMVLGTAGDDRRSRTCSSRADVLAPDVSASLTMPELPEVNTLRPGLEATVLGERIASVAVLSG